MPHLRARGRTSPLDLFPQPVRRPLRRLVRRVVPSPLQVVYDARYNASFPSAPNDPLRAERILACLACEGLLLRRDVHRPRRATARALGRVHDAAYLDSLLDAETISAIMGIEVLPQQIDRLVGFQRIGTGGSVLAAKLAVERHTIAVNLGGGFHHAKADRGEGFCIFNDVAVAIAHLRERGTAGPILVVDLDLHDGNGTRLLYRDDPTVHTYSLHASHWDEPEAVESTAIELGSKVDDARYLEVLRETLPPVVARFAPEVVIYLAGCDPAHDDEMGDWRITAAGMLARDRFVLDTVRPRAARPMVILLAGGYGTESWRYTSRFLSSILLHGKAVEPPPTAEMTLRRYRYLSSLFAPEELSGGSDDSFGLTEEDLFLPGWGAMRETRFLGYYTTMGIELALDRAGILDRLRDLGYAHPQLEFDLDDPGGQTLRITDEAAGDVPLVELRLRRDRRAIEGMELLSVEWLMMQHPLGRFPEGRSPLPDQKHPGLGMLGDVVALLIQACHRLGLDGLVFTPARYHVAAIGGEYLAFLRKDDAARFAAIREAVAGMSLAEATRAVAEGRVVGESGEVLEWRPGPMVLAVSSRLRGVVEGRGVG